MNFSQDPIHTQETLISRYATRSKSLYIVMVVVVLVVLGALPFIYVDISSQSRGIIRSQQDKVPLQTVVSGKIISCLLKNNKLVKKGDTLVQIAQDILQTEKASTQATVNDNQILLNDLQQAVSGQGERLRTAVMVQEWYSYTSRRNELLEKYHFAQQEHDRQKKLFDKGVISASEFEKFLHAAKTAQQAVAVLEKSQKAQWQNRHRELLVQSKNLTGTIQKIATESKNYYVTAPVSGVITEFSGVQVGSFFTPSQPIAVITPIDQQLVECTVSPDDIGLIHKNQEVKFQMDAFNYNQWGLLTGRVIDIDKNITLQENQAFFKVRCALNAPTLQLKSGYTTRATNGMTLTARYTLTRRSLFDLLFDKMDDWLNPKLVSVQ
ncbi:HlyD family secretion protein [Flavobacterium davisii]|uniref:HlyD family secretion protein n=1 Tax=Flavobacterium davisii TaxID=2906077 RepID=UPI0035CFE9B5